MTNSTQLLINSKQSKMKANYIGPRMETLTLIRIFARIYEFKPNHTPDSKNFLLN